MNTATEILAKAVRQRRFLIRTRAGRQDDSLKQSISMCSNILERNASDADVRRFIVAHRDRVLDLLTPRDTKNREFIMNIGL